MEFGPKNALEIILSREPFPPTPIYFTRDENDDTYYLLRREVACSVNVYRESFRHFLHSPLFQPSNNRVDAYLDVSF